MRFKNIYIQLLMMGLCTFSHAGLINRFTCTKNIKAVATALLSKNPQAQHPHCLKAAKKELENPRSKLSKILASYPTLNSTMRVAIHKQTISSQERSVLESIVDEKKLQTAETLAPSLLRTKSLPNPDSLRNQQLELYNHRIRQFFLFMGCEEGDGGTGNFMRTVGALESCNLKELDQQRRGVLALEKKYSASEIDFLKKFDLNKFKKIIQLFKEKIFENKIKITNEDLLADLQEFNDFPYHIAKIEASILMSCSAEKSAEECKESIIDPILKNLKACSSVIQVAGNDLPCKLCSSQPNLTKICYKETA